MDVLTADEIERFVADGFVHLRAAFNRDVAAACVDELWPLTGVDRDDPSSWTEPVVRIAGSGAPPLVAAINSDRLCGALDQLVGAGRWQRRTGYGTFPVRFPTEEDPGDAGWHVDASFELAGEYGLNLASRGRALLLLMLFTDVGPGDAPTRILAGSHHEVARVLQPHGERGATFLEVCRQAVPAVAHRPVVTAEGGAGDVFLCHPFLVHAASWPHRGRTPRFLGQPPILHQPSDGAFRYERADGAYSPCERAVRAALSA